MLLFALAAERSHGKHKGRGQSPAAQEGEQAQAPSSHVLPVCWWWYGSRVAWCKHVWEILGFFRRETVMDMIYRRPLHQRRTRIPTTHSQAQGGACHGVGALPLNGAQGKKGSRAAWKKYVLALLLSAWREGGNEERTSHTRELLAIPRSAGCKRRVERRQKNIIQWQQKYCFSTRAYSRAVCCRPFFWLQCFSIFILRNFYFHPFFS